ncbi:MAG: major capsid protein [Pseudomonadota bacterium]
MRYFDEALISNSRPHEAWWDELCNVRGFWADHEEHLCAAMNSTAILPDEAWREVDQLTKRIMRDDEGQAYMVDLLPLAKPVNIGKLVHLNRVSSDAGKVTRSMSGQVPDDIDKVEYAHRGVPVPIFSAGFGRNWREWNTQQSENFDAISDDTEAHGAAIRQDMAQYALDGDPNMSVEGYDAVGIRTSPLSKSINLGSAGGGANIDLTSATTDAIEAFFDEVIVTALDDNKVGDAINVYVSPEIMRRLNKPYSASAGFKGGTLLEQLQSKRYINKIERTFELTGNEFFSFVPNAQYIRPIIGMAVNTTAKTRINPTDNYHFLMMGAMGIEIRADFGGRSGTFYSVVQN